MRWGATRVFAHHFAAIATRDPLIAALLRLADDPVVAVRLQAIRGLWQAWFWNPGAAVRGQIEDTLLAALAQPQHPWIETNLRAAIYNLADENIRYLYNNWVALLGKPEDRDRAMQGRLAVESQLAVKFAAVLEHGPDAQKKRLLAALAELPLRRGDAYELAAASTRIRRPCTAASATISSRLRSSARARPCSRARFCRCSIPPMRRCACSRATPA